jgi:hypothetical protein
VYRPFRFQKCCQDFIGSHDETLSVAMSVRVHAEMLSATRALAIEIRVSVAAIAGLSMAFVSPKAFRVTSCSLLRITSMNDQKMRPNNKIIRKES